MIAAIAPRNILELLWAKDIADHDWEIQRYRKLEARLLASGSGASRTEAMGSRAFAARARAQSEAFDWVWKQTQTTGKDRNVWWKEIRPEQGRLEEEYMTDAQNMLEREGQLSTPDFAGSFLKNMAELEHISRAISMAQARRTAALCALERHRMKQAARSEDYIVDAAFADVS